MENKEQQLSARDFVIWLKTHLEQAEKFVPKSGNILATIIKQELNKVFLHEAESMVVKKPTVEPPLVVKKPLTIPIQKKYPPTNRPLVARC